MLGAGDRGRIIHVVTFGSPALQGSGQLVRGALARDNNLVHIRVARNGELAVLQDIEPAAGSLFREALHRWPRVYMRRDPDTPRPVGS